MENYIVRIYGRDPRNSDKVTGLLESVEAKTRRAFHSLDALRSMLDLSATPCTQNKLSLMPLHVPQRENLTTEEQ